MNKIVDMGGLGIHRQVLRNIKVVTAAACARLQVFLKRKEVVCKTLKAERIVEEGRAQGPTMGHIGYRPPSP